MTKRNQNTGEDIFRLIQSAFAVNEGANHQKEPADVDIPPIEYKGQRVITTELLAQVYESTPKNIRMNFANHEDNFKEGIHYYLLHGETLSQFRLWANDIGVQISPMARTLYLWTERGANRHCKILDTPKAWEQFDNLEETYFFVKETVKGITGQFQHQLPAFYPTKATSLGEVASFLKELRITMEKARQSPETVLRQVELTCKQFGAATIPDFARVSPFEQMAFYLPEPPTQPQMPQ